MWEYLVVIRYWFFWSNAWRTFCQSWHKSYSQAKGWMKSFCVLEISLFSCGIFILYISLSSIHVSHITGIRIQSVQMYGLNQLRYQSTSFISWFFLILLLNVMLSWFLFLFFLFVLISFLTFSFFRKHHLYNSVDWYVPTSHHLGSYHSNTYLLPITLSLVNQLCYSLVLFLSNNPNFKINCSKHCIVGCSSSVILCCCACLQ